jgi:hypothetical protein
MLLGDCVFQYCLRQACHAPLEQAAAAFAVLGAYLTGPQDVSIAYSTYELVNELEQSALDGNSILRLHLVQIIFQGSAVCCRRQSWAAL